MKLISYNVNGIRAAMNKGFLDWLAQESPDVIGLQEIKALDAKYLVPSVSRCLRLIL